MPTKTNLITTTNPLKIVAAAIRDDNGLVHSLLPPARHHDIIRALRQSGYTGSVQGDMQGFLLSDGRFARRVPAKRVAEKAGQLIGGKTKADTLTSEDLW